MIMNLELSLLLRLPSSSRQPQRYWLDYPSLVKDGNDPAKPLLSCENKTENTSFLMNWICTSLTRKLEITAALCAHLCSRDRKNFL